MEGNALIFPKLEVLDGAGGGTRTLTSSQTPDFESVKIDLFPVLPIWL